jgi:hypothetical protein
VANGFTFGDMRSRLNCHLSVEFTGLVYNRGGVGKPALVNKVPFVQETFSVVGHEKWHRGGRGVRGQRTKGKARLSPYCPWVRSPSRRF